MQLITHALVAVESKNLKCDEDFVAFQHLHGECADGDETQKLIVDNLSQGNINRFRGHSQIDLASLEHI